MKNRVVRYHQHGHPLDVLNLEVIEAPIIGDDEVLIEMQASTIHPSDFGLISGTYGKLRELPAIGGREGVGKVVEVGKQVDSRVMGKLVSMPESLGVWLDYSKCKVKDLIYLPALIPLDQLAVAILNPLTAWRLLNDFEYLREKDFIIQNAGNSSVGLSVIQFAKQMGIRCISLVRNEDRIEEIKIFGADEVWLDDDRVPARVREFTQGRMCSLSLNSIGGRSALRLAKCLKSSGIHVTFGAMDSKPIRFPTRNLIFDNVRFVGFWLDRWQKEQSDSSLRNSIEKVLRPLALTQIKHPIDRIFSLENFSQGLIRNSESRMGKVVLEREQGLLDGA
tara:strand:+ start:224 stop:1228 length:1005 start_codon:yes stop_codon:yes gene_type:complete